VAGLTLVEPLAEVEVKDPGVMAMDRAPLVAQLRVLLVPEFTVVGFAANEVIVGAEPFPGGGLCEVIRAQLANPKPASKARSGAQKFRLGGLSQR